MCNLRRPWLALVAGVLLATCAVMSFAWFLEPSEPSWNERRLSVWLRQIQQGSPTEQQEAEVALRGLGAKSIPFLLRWLNSHDNLLKRTFYDMLPGRKQLHFQPEWAFDRQWMAASGFSILGTNAHAAMPQLAGLLGDGKRGRAAAGALSGIGPAAVPVLTNLLFQPQTAQDAAYGLTRFGEEAVPVLLLAVWSTNRSVHVAAMCGLHFCIFDSYLWQDPNLGRRALGSSAKFNATCISVASAAYYGRESAFIKQMMEKCELSTNGAIAAAALATKRKLEP